MNDFKKGYIIGFLVAIVCMLICATHDLLKNAEKNYVATTAHIITQQEEAKN